MRNYRDGTNRSRDSIASSDVSTGRRYITMPALKVSPTDLFTFSTDRNDWPKPLTFELHPYSVKINRRGKYPGQRSVRSIFVRVYRNTHAPDWLLLPDFQSERGEKWSARKQRAVVLWFTRQTCLQCMYTRYLQSTANAKCQSLQAVHSWVAPLRVKPCISADRTKISSHNCCLVASSFHNWQQSIHQSKTWQHVLAPNN